MSRMQPRHRVFVAGHRGLVGSSLVDELRSRGYDQILTRPRAELDLADRAAVRAYFADVRPDIVLLAAARVGGIVANATMPADFIHENLAIASNVIWEAHAADVARLVFLGSSCIYPRAATQPMLETSLLSGPLEPTNRPYAVAKIAGLELVHALRRQFGRDYFSVMPTNLYGPGDNFHPEHSHVLPGLLRRFHIAKRRDEPEVAVWGSGTPRREFLLASDCAVAVVHLAETLEAAALDGSYIGKAGFSHVNIGSGQECTIAELACMIAEVVGYRGRVVFDESKPDGPPRKLVDSRFLHDSGWKARNSLLDGLRQTYDWLQRSAPLS